MQNHSRRSFLKTLGLTATALGFSNILSASAKNAKRPNIILYVVDDQGSTDAGCYGNPVIKTPGLDLLAKDGVRFTNAFCTTASCSASRSVILSGLHNHKNGQYGHAQSYHHFSSFSNIKTLPVLLAEAGYRTMSSGKYHVAPESVYHFQEYLNNRKNPAGRADACKQFIISNEQQPFFLYFCTTEPHRPFHRAGSAEFDPKDVIVPPYLPDSPECREELAQYYGSVERADSGLLRLITILKQTGHWDNTAILYVSDNGIAFPGAKTNLYDPGMKLPCVVRLPSLKNKGSVNQAMISWADLTPTILDMAQAIPDDYTFHGRSFFNILGQENPNGWDEVYASHTFHEITMYYPMRVIRERRYKLIWNIAYKLDFPFASDLWTSKTWQGVLKRNEEKYAGRSVAGYIQRPKFELFDLETDPLELNNLADNPEYAAVLARLQAKLKKFQEDTGDPWVKKWRYE